MLCAAREIDIRVAREESALLSCGDYFGFPVFMNDESSRLALEDKIKKKCQDAVGRLNCFVPPASDILSDTVSINIINVEFPFI